MKPIFLQPRDKGPGKDFHPGGAHRVLLCCRQAVGCRGGFMQKGQLSLLGL